ncbi:MAG: molybdenum cofactor guanylyltransferase [Bryobacteraceae bacterium]|nr:molybdenum cofactor guanylyltransferase [Bryobacteraceae bacterium]
MEGFVLCGGQSVRMGQDKALLPLNGVPLVVHIAGLVRAATGSATLVGSRERYGNLGWPLVEDDPPGDGPLGGIIAALRATRGEKALIVACDMPWLTADSLRALAGTDFATDALVAAGNHPLCAIYRKRCLPVLEQALREGDRKVRRVLERLSVEEWPVDDPRWVANANTPAEWAAVKAGV